jgi:hypothetical protein
LKFFFQKSEKFEIFLFFCGIGWFRVGDAVQLGELMESCSKFADFIVDFFVKKGVGVMVSKFFF